MRASSLGHGYGRAIAAALVYLFAFHFAYRSAMSFSAVTASPFWLPDSVVLCALLVSRPRHWWMLLLATLPLRLFADVSRAVPLWFLLATFAIDAIKSVLTAIALRRVLRDPLRLETLRDFALFCLIAALLFPAASAFPGAAARTALGAAFWTSWEQWFLGDALTQLVVTPVILVWVLAPPWRKPLSRRRVTEAALLAIGLVLAAAFAFDRAAVDTGAIDPRFYLPVPLLFWAAVRFGLPGATAAVAVVAFSAIHAALVGRPAFAGRSPEATALALQQYLLLRAVPTYLVAIAVGEQRRAQERASAMLRAMPDVMFLLTRAGIFVDASAADPRQLFVPRSALVGHHLKDVLPTDLAARLMSAIADLSAAKPAIVEYTLEVASGPGHFEARLVAADDEHVLAIVRDVTAAAKAETAQKSMELALAETRTALDRAGRLAALGEFADSIAHEVRQPLTAILMNADIGLAQARRPAPDLAAIQTSLTEIADAGGRADQVIERNRTLFRDHTVRKTPLDINRVVNEAVALTATRVRSSGVTLVPSYAKGLPKVSGDRIELQQVLLNLIGNSIEAIDGLPANRRRITVSTVAAAGGGVRIAVSDRGVGLSGVDLARMFTLSYTTKAHGTGVGLSISRSIVEAHGGRLWAEDNPGGGATLLFTLPADPEPARA